MLSNDRLKLVIRLIWIAVPLFSLLSGATAASIAFDHVIYLPLIALQLPTHTPMIYNNPLISEVLYDPLGDEPGGEWIELYNPGVNDFDLSRYKVGDAELPGDREGMYRFPSGASMPPLKVIVIANRAVSFEAVHGFKPDYEISSSDPAVPDMIKHYAWSGYNLELTDTGDEVLLLNAQDQIVDALSWGSSTFAFDPPISKVPQGCSLERKPADRDQDAALDWISQCLPAPGLVDILQPTATLTSTGTPTSTCTSTLTQTPEPCGEVAVLISEFLYDPVGDMDPQGEWIEIYNPSDREINLSCIKLGDEETFEGGEGMLNFPAGAWLSSQGIAIVANQASVFFETYGFNPDFEILESDPSVPVMIKYTHWATGALNLSNTGDEILILDTNDRPVDVVSWGNSVFAFDPPVSAVMEGHSLERQPANWDTDSPLDWKDQPVPDPGKINLSTPTPPPSFTPTKTPTISPTPTVTPLPCRTFLLLITEVLYDPLGDTDTGKEWIEIYNPGDQGINLACVKLGDEETYGGGEGMLVFPDNRVIEPDQAIIVANRAALFHSTYSFDPDYEIIDSDYNVPDMLRYTSWGSGSFNLSNSGDEVLILDWLDDLVDVVSWGSSTFAFDPAVELVVEGHSLERIPANMDTDSAGDWFDQMDPNPGKISPATSTISVTNTPTRTSSPTPTKTGTPTPIHTLTPTRTSTPTITPHQSPTPTFTLTPSVTVTPSSTPTATLINTPTLTQTPSETSSPTNTLTPSLTPSITPTSTSDKACLLVSEVYYYPIEDGPYGEWIEVYNPSSNSFELSNYKIGDEESAGGAEGMMRFPGGAWIAPGQAVVVANRANTFFDLYQFMPDFEINESIPEVPNLDLYPSWSNGVISLGNSGDEVLLLDGQDRVIDAVAYGLSEYPDFQPPVSTDEVIAGYSIERYPADQDTNTSSDWIVQSRPNPGTVNLTTWQLE